MNPKDPETLLTILDILNEDLDQSRETIYISIFLDRSWKMQFRFDGFHVSRWSSSKYESGFISNELSIFSQKEQKYILDKITYLNSLVDHLR